MLRGLVMSARLYTAVSSAGYSASVTGATSAAAAVLALAASASALALAPVRAATRRFSAWASCRRRCRLKASASLSRLEVPTTVICRPGRSVNALATLSRPCLALSDSVALPASNVMVLDSPLPPPRPPVSRLNGDVTALTIRLTSAFQISGPTLNCGSLMEPDNGKSTLMTPLRSASSATASRTGRLFGAPCTSSPNCSWFNTMLLVAVSRPSGAIL